MGFLSALKGANNNCFNFKKSTSLIKHISSDCGEIFEIERAFFHRALCEGSRRLSDLAAAEKRVL